MYRDEFEKGYQEVIAVIEGVIDNQLDENNHKLKTMNVMLQTDISSFEELLDETSDTADYLSGMYKIKHTLMCSSGSVIARSLDQDIETGRGAALDIIETVILRSKKGLDNIEDKTKKEECTKKIKGAEFLYDQIKEKLRKTNKLD